MEEVDLQNAHSYTVCNGLSNQLLGHAGQISNAISSQRNILIPDAFIVNGVPHEKDGSVLKNILPTKDNSIPLSRIIDTDALLQMVRGYGIKVQLVPYEDVFDNAIVDQTCDWLTAVQESEDSLTLKVLKSFQPSPHLASIIRKMTSNLLAKVGPDSSLSDGVCIHHRNGQDWHDHCKQWEGIDDGNWRKNCEVDRNLPLHELINNRIPAAYKKSWLYYVADTDPTSELVQQFQDHGLRLISRSSDTLLDKDAVNRLMPNRKGDISTTRDIFAVIDFFTCSNIESFVGNSVSTFSALQIARRNGHNSWYNSRSIPLATFFQAYYVPIVYTYTERSEGVGKYLLKASIQSTRKILGMNAQIHILYHGSEDTDFLAWLSEHGVIRHKHEPTWLDDMEKIRLNGDPERSHLFAHQGNYIGTWQRIDIPLFIDSEYCLLLDADTVVAAPFTIADFGADIPPVVAFSTEGDEEGKDPWNAGVALFNVPRLRESHDEFMQFIRTRSIEKEPFSSPSDQGAYKDFYDIQFIDHTFNVKSYWRLSEHIEQRKVVHFHGAKPHQILKSWMGYESDVPAINGILAIVGEKEHQKNPCIMMRDFAVAISSDALSDAILQEYCVHTIDGDNVERCVNFFMALARMQTTNEVDHCKDILIT